MFDLGLGIFDRISTFYHR